MLKGARGRRGFTLIETVVTVGIVATLAAVVVPQVVKQFDTADPTRLQNDLKGLSSAISTFTVNLNGSVPGDLDDLANPLSNTGDFTLVPMDTTITPVGGTAKFGNVAGWKGPYVDFGVIPGATRATGFGGLIEHNFVCFVGSGPNLNTFGTAANQACPTFSTTNRLFLAVRVSGLTATQFEQINDLFDGTGEPDGTAAGQSQVVGKARYLGNVTYFLAAPLN